MNKDMIWYWFTNINGIGRKTRNILLKQYNLPEQLYYDQEENIRKLDIINNNKRERIIESRKNYKADEMIHLKKKGITFIHPESELYPVKLMDIPDYPHSLYVRGNVIDFNKPSVSVIGSRKCSKYGYETAYKIGYELSMNGITVVSGMATGIDSAAHRGCIEAQGYTIAVLGCGVDICYPKHNIELYMNIMNNGMVISENPVMTQPRAGLFPERNRIISGLGDIIVVVEAGEKSGTFITVDMALEQGKEVYVVPGRISDIQSKGCNSLISQGANIYTGIEEILNHFENRKKFNTEKNIEDNFVNDIKRVYDFIKIFPKHIDEVAQTLEIPIEYIIKILLEMEMKGIIKHCGNNFYTV